MVKNNILISLVKTKYDDKKIMYITFLVRLTMSDTIANTAPSIIVPFNIYKVEVVLFASV